MRWIPICAALALAGCSGDLASGLTTASLGGPSTSRVAETLYRVQVPQGAGESVEAVQNRVLIEAARQARQASATHFVVVKTGTTEANRDYLGSFTKARPDAEAYVRMLTLPAGSGLPTGAVSVDEVERFVAGGDTRPRT